MRGNIGNLMKQAQKMQEDMKKAQEELANLEVTGQAGGGMVQVTMTGRHEVKRYELDPSLLTDDDKEMLEDLLAAATNDAVNKIAKETEERYSGLMGGMGDLPAGMKLPF
jgi:hypothetical protein